MIIKFYFPLVWDVLVWFVWSEPDIIYHLDWAGQTCPPLLCILSRLTSDDWCLQKPSPPLANLVLTQIYWLVTVSPLWESIGPFAVKRSWKFLNEQAWTSYCFSSSYKSYNFVFSTMMWLRETFQTHANLPLYTHGLVPCSKTWDIFPLWSVHCIFK